MKTNGKTTKVTVNAMDTKFAIISFEGKPIEYVQNFSHLGQINC